MTIHENPLPCNPMKLFWLYIVSCDHHFLLLSPLWLTATGKVPMRSFFIRLLCLWFDNDVAGQSMQAGGTSWHGSTHHSRHWTMGISGVANLHSKAFHPPTGNVTCMNIPESAQTHRPTGHAAYFMLKNCMDFNRLCVFFFFYYAWTQALCHRLSFSYLYYNGTTLCHGHTSHGQHLYLSLLTPSTHLSTPTHSPLHFY